MPKFDEKGRELPDATPVQVPVHFTRPPTLQEQIRSMVRSEELRRLVESRGQETFEEADDFEVGDDFDPTSPYETVFDPDSGKEMTRPEKAFLDAQRAQFDTEVKKAQSQTKPKKEAKPKADPIESEED